MSETVAEWKSRKRAQEKRFLDRYPFLRNDPGFDYGTKFSLVSERPAAYLVIGQVERHEIGQKRIDLTDAEIEEWVSRLRQ